MGCKVAGLGGRAGSPLPLLRPDLHNLLPITFPLPSPGVKFKNIFNFDETSLDILYDAFDTDHSGTLELAEMISGLSFLCRGSVEEKLRFLFTVYDADSSGFLEHSELLPMFQKLTDQLVSLETASKRRNNEIGKGNSTDEGNVMRGASKVKELSDEFKQLSDLDGDGKISYEEFEEYMSNNEMCKKFLQIMTETGNTLREENTNFS
jgi:Ca2+-binding EF-hand superfamily protein